MAIFSFFEVDPREALPLSGNYTRDVGDVFTIPTGLYDTIGMVRTDDATDDGFLEDQNGPTEDAYAEITLSDSTTFGSWIKIERTWTLQWDDNGTTRTVRIAEFEYNRGGGEIDGMVADGLLPPIGTQVTVVGYNGRPNMDSEGFAYGDITTDIACFVRGTRIMTVSGEVAVEDLCDGDMIRTRDNGDQPLRWIGRTKVEAKGRLAPVEIKAGVLGNHSDLHVSPCHRMVVDSPRNSILFDEVEVLATARQLCGRDGVSVRSGGEVEYFHLLFDRHEIIFAEGAATESFHPAISGISAMDRTTREELLTLFPDLASDGEGGRQLARRALQDAEAAVI